MSHKTSLGVSRLKWSSRKVTAGSLHGKFRPDVRPCRCACEPVDLTACACVACDAGVAEKDFVSANLVQVLHKLLSDERSAPEIKYNSMILICAVMGSGKCPTAQSGSLIYNYVEPAVS